MTHFFDSWRSKAWSSVAFFVVSVLGILGVNAAPPATAPNVLFIMADDLGWSDVDFHGGKTPTPNLNRLRTSGIELTHHYVAPLCSPTRASLLTGRFWSRFGITMPTSDRVLSDDVTTLPRALAARGYTTSLIGKWHLGSLPEWGPQRVGFQQSYGSLGGGVTPYTHQYKRGPFVDTWRRDGELVQEEGHVTDLLTAEAVRQIANADSEPFFI